MEPGSGHARALAGSASAIFDERLTVSWWAWPLAIGAAAFFAAELAIGAYALRHWSTFVIAGGLAAAALLVLGHIRVRVQTGGAEAVLRVDDAVLPLSAVAGVHTVDPTQRRELLGPSAEPLAFVVQRPWISGGVRIDLADPADPTPYWFISTRRPGALVAALHRAGVPVSHG